MSYWANEDQQDHMRSLATVPPSERCPSGWHVLARESCDCARYYAPHRTLADRMRAATPTPSAP